MDASTNTERPWAIQMVTQTFDPQFGDSIESARLAWKDPHSTEIWGILEPKRRWSRVHGARFARGRFTHVPKNIGTTFFPTVSTQATADIIDDALTTVATDCRVLVGNAARYRKSFEEAHERVEIGQYQMVVSPEGCTRHDDVILVDLGTREKDLRKNIAELATRFKRANLCPPYIPDSTSPTFTVLAPPTMPDALKVPPPPLKISEKPKPKITGNMPWIRRKRADNKEPRFDPAPKRFRFIDVTSSKLPDPGEDVIMTEPESDPLAVYPGVGFE